MKKIIALIIISGLLYFGYTRINYIAYYSEHPELLIGLGMMMESHEAEKLNKALEKNPDNLNARLKLIGYYNYRQYKSDSARCYLHEHALWLIEKHPDSTAAESTYFYFASDEEAFEKASKSWDMNIYEHPENSNAIGNAGDFYKFKLPKKAEKLLIKAVELDPNNYRWIDQLGDTYLIMVRKAENKEDAIKYSEKALDCFSKARPLYPDEIADFMNFYRLTEMLKLEYYVGNYDDVKKHALELLEIAELNKDDWNYGNAIHKANIMLGMIALDDGDNKKAAEYLIAAGNTLGSCQLDSYGPDMSLAVKLIDEGEIESVIEYLTLSKRFWKFGKDKIDILVDALQQGIIPEHDSELYWWNKN